MSVQHSCKIANDAFIPHIRIKLVSVAADGLVTQQMTSNIAHPLYFKTAHYPALVMWVNLRGIVPDALKPQ